MSEPDEFEQQLQEQLQSLLSDVDVKAAETDAAFSSVVQMWVGLVKGGMPQLSASIVIGTFLYMNASERGVEEEED